MSFLMPKRAGLFTAAIVVMMTQWACGRDEISRTCAIDSECDPGQICYIGKCVEGDDVPTNNSTVNNPTVNNPTQNNFTPGPDDGLVDPPDMPEEIDFEIPPPPPECTTTAECPLGGADFEDGPLCVAYECVESECVIQNVAVSCPPDAAPDGCGCTPLPPECESNEECGAFVCVNGGCQPCNRNSECGDLVCDDDGTCKACVQELDCSANEICEDNTCVPRPECIFDMDCDEFEICLNGRCSYSPECTEDTDCLDGYECIGERCFEALCRGAEDCAPDELCDAGACVPQPVRIDSCFVATPSSTVSPGQNVQLSAFAIDSMGNGIAANFVWSSDDPAVVSVAGSTAVAQNRAGVVKLTAALAGGMPIQCIGEVELNNVGPPPNMGQLRVVVLDADTNMPVVGAEVVVDSANTGITNASGVANLLAPSGEYEVSVFSQEHDWVTVQGVRSQDIRIPVLPRSGTGDVAGFQGRFDMSQVASSGDFNLGLAGASIPGGLINFDLTTLLGDPFQTSISIPGQGDVAFPLPGGLTLYGRVFGFSINVKRDYYASTSGGARLAWGLAGKLPATELVGLFMNGGIGGVGDVLTLLLPLFNRFDHAIKPMNLTPTARVVDAGDIDGDGDITELVPDYMNFPDADLAPSVSQQLVTSVGVSNLPDLTDGPAEVSILLGGTQLDSVGFVPLGISAATDADGDGRPDVRRLTMAPPYSSLVGGRYAVLSIAFRTDALGAGPNGVAFPDEFSVALWNGQALPTTLQLGTFPDASFVFEDPARRELFIDATAGPLYRARFVGQDRSWDVWSPGAPGVMGFYNHSLRVPNVPVGRADLFFTADKVLLDAIRTQIKIDDLLKPSGILLLDAALVSTGFSRTLVR